MERRKHVQVVQDPDSHEWRWRLHYGNNRKGPGAEESFTQAGHVLVVVRTTYPDLPIRVRAADGSDYWIETDEPAHLKH